MRPSLTFSILLSQIAAGGVGTALALKTAFETHKIPGKVILLGTPAEEGGFSTIEPVGELSRI